MPKISKEQEEDLLNCIDCSHNDKASIRALKRGGPWRNYGVTNFDEYLEAKRYEFYKRYLNLALTGTVGALALYTYFQLRQKEEDMKAKKHIRKKLNEIPPSRKFRRSGQKQRKGTKRQSARYF